MDIDLTSIITEYIEEHFPEFNKTDIEDKCGYTWDSIRKCFAVKYGISVGTFVRRVMLIHAYSLWLSEGAPTLSKRDEYKGIKEFANKFEKEFYVDINTALTQNIKIEDYLVMNEKKIIKEGLTDLKNNRLIDDFNIHGDIVSVTINPETMLAFMLSMETIIVPKEFQKNVLDKLDDDAKKFMLFLVLSDESILNMCEKDEVKITSSPEELETFFIFIDKYNLDSPDKFEDFYLYHSFFDDSAKTIFMTIIDRIVEHTRFCINEKMLVNRELQLLYDLLHKNVPKNNIESLAKMYGCPTNDFRELLWKYTYLGILRYEDAVSAII